VHTVTGVAQFPRRSFHSWLVPTTAPAGICSIAPLARILFVPDRSPGGAGPGPAGCQQTNDQSNKQKVERKGKAIAMTKNAGQMEAASLNSILRKNIRLRKPSGLGARRKMDRPCPPTQPSGPLAGVSFAMTASMLQPALHQHLVPHRVSRSTVARFQPGDGAFSGEHAVLNRQRFTSPP